MVRPRRLSNCCGTGEDAGVKAVRSLGLALLLAVSLAAPVGAASAPFLPEAPNCPMFPTTNVWNKPVNGLPVASNSSTLIASIGLNAYLHPDFSSYNGGGYGIPYNTVAGTRKKVHVKFQYADQSDPGPYPIPRHPKIEGGSDRHMLIVDRDNCVLYELFAARKTSTGWKAGSGAIWNLNSNALRPAGWTSADAAGLPILPGLVRYDEVAAGVINHALRFTAPVTRRAYIYPARHYASDDTSASLPPMGLRVRLKASVNISGFGPQAQVLLQALKTYGMILADNGGDWFVTGAPDSRWNDDEVETLKRVKGSDFEVVKMGEVVTR